MGGIKGNVELKSRLEERRIMNQESGMPIKFQAWDKKDLEMLDWKYLLNLMLVETRENIFTNEDLIVRQAIGATDNSDPKQELYFGDVIGFNLDKKDVIGEIVWLNFSVWVRLWRNENTFSYLSMSHVLDYFKIKKLGSSHTKEGQEILRKAGLEKP